MFDLSDKGDAMNHDDNQNRPATDAHALEGVEAAELGRILDASLNEIYIFDAGSLKFLQVNRGARENLGYSLDEMREMTPLDLKPEFSSDRFSELIGPLRSGESEKVRFETAHLRKDGSSYDIEVDLQLDTFHGRPAFVAIILDITKRKRVERELRDSEERNRCVLDTAANAIVTMGPDRRIESVNRATEKMFGYTAEELIGNNVSILMPSPYRERHDGFVRNYLQTGENKIIGTSRELVGQRKDGSVIPIELFIGDGSLSDGRRLFTGIIRDLTEYKTLERALLRISENERRNIGREIHDDLCQRIFGIRCLIQVLEQKLTGVPEAQREAIAELTDMVTEAHGRARAMAHGLMPVALEADGLMAALEELATTTEKNCAVKCTFNCKDPVLLEDDGTAVQFFRIAQEAVANAVRHGRPRSIEISLMETDANVVLEISDDGDGIPAPDKRTAGMGLLTMTHRARMLGGHCEVANHGGAVVTCVVPAPTH